MRHVTTVLLMCSALALGSLASAQTPQPKPASPSKPAAAKAMKATTMMETGTISKVDPANGALTLTTSKGEEQFTLGSSARLSEGSHKIDAAALAKLTGREARVRYTDNAGQKVVQSVSVSESMARKGKKNS